MKLHAIAMGACCASTLAQATITWTGGIQDGQWVGVEAVAAGGVAVIGTANFPAGGGATIGRAYRWTAATGIVNLGTLPSSLTYPYSDATACSADGTVLTGRSYTTGDRCIRWTPGGGMVEMPVLPGGTAAGGTSITPDGSVIIGWCSVPGSGRVTRWDSAGVHDLGVPPWHTRASAGGASADASVITGSSNTSFAVDDRAFVLDATGWTDLGVLPGDTLSRAAAVSGDGTTVIGYSRGPAPSPQHGFRWTRAEGLVPIPAAAGVPNPSPLALSSDGSVIVGSVSGIGDGFAWTRWGGTQNIRTLLSAHGVDLTGWTMVIPCAITADGRTIAGHARDGTGYQAWIATLPIGFACYANCDSSTAAPVLNIADFTCFLNRFAAADTAANCDGSTTPPTLNIADFTCFLNRFAAGCS